MRAFDTIVVRVALVSVNKEIAAYEVFIPVPASGQIKSSELIDACQRSVAHCVDELKKDLDI